MFRKIFHLYGNTMQPSYSSVIISTKIYPITNHFLRLCNNAHLTLNLDWLNPLNYIQYTLNLKIFIVKVFS